MKLLHLAWRQTLRDLAAGEIRLMLMAIMLAVMAVTAVGMITERAETGLQQEANRLLGGDAVCHGEPCMEKLCCHALRFQPTIGGNRVINRIAQPGDGSTAA